MELIITDCVQYALIKITGRVDSYTASELNQAFESLFTEKQFNIIVDMQDVSFISSSGILVFVNHQKYLRQQKQGEIAFIHISNNLCISFELVGFHTLFEFYDDLPTAVEKFKITNQ